MSDSPPKILIIDDHDLFSEGMRLMLERRFKGCAVFKAASGAQGLTAVRRYHALDLVLLDLRLGDVHGFKVLKSIRALRPGLPVVVVSSLEEAALVAEAQALGAALFIPKSAPAARFAAELKKALKNSPHAQAIQAGARTLGLTSRQQQVLKLVAQGLSNKEISTDLGLRYNTVRVHMAGILKALGVKCRSEAAARAQSLGWGTHA